MNPQRLLTIFAILVVLLVLFLYLTSSDEAFLEPSNTGPPEVTGTAGALRHGIGHENGAVA